jgi:PAS domain-containing protein
MVLDEAIRSDGNLCPDAEQTLEVFEKLLKSLASPQYLFRLYVSGSSSRSALSIAVSAPPVRWRHVPHTEDLGRAASQGLIAMTHSAIRSDEAQEESLLARLELAEAKLAEAQQVIQAIQSGEVDAVVVSRPEGNQVFTLKTAEYAYRALVEAMNEGAATLGSDGTVFYCNQSLSCILSVPIERIIGSQMRKFSIPLGGYVPVFVPASEDHSISDVCSIPVSLTVHTKPASVLGTKGATLPHEWRRWLLGAAAAVVYSAALIGITWLATTRVHKPQPSSAEPAHALWAALFNGQVNTYVVPADAGFNLLEDMAQRPIQLADYISRGYLKLPLPGMDAHSADDLRSQHFTSFVDFQTVAALSRLPEYNPQRSFLRFPRDLRLDDLKNANAILIGSMGSNPWSSIADSNANFRIVYGQGMQGATIINARPQPNEAASYASHWSEPAHETFALIAFLPNLDGTGHLLLLQGLDVAGTQAAAESLFHGDAITTVLRQAIRPDGSIRHFEILLRSTSIESNSTGTQVIATRIY